MNTRYAYLGLVIALSGCLLWSCVANAQRAPCAERSVLVADLAEKFQEHPAAVGALDAAVMELLLSDGGSWSLIVSTPDGRSCLIATGGDWKQTRLPGRRASLVERMGDSIKPR